jgi:hypothetical protein
LTFEKRDLLEEDIPLIAMVATPSLSKFELSSLNSFLRGFIIKHDESIELPLNHFYLGHPHGLRSFMCHLEGGPNFFGFIQAIHMVELFLVHR